MPRRLVAEVDAALGQQILDVGAQLFDARLE